MVRNSSNNYERVHLTTEYVIGGSRITSLESFYDEISRVLIRDAYWGKNLDAFSDILRGGFGTPDEGFTIRWSHSDVSKQRLGYPETVRQLERRLQRCHPSNRDHIRQELADARAGTGPTAFDWLLWIIDIHCPGGEEEADNVRLVLE
ncbi:MULTISPECIES: barstar family protein [Rhizobium]|uniref:Barstar, RNAse (Barnase) inhibitor n=1 Tax=Rhizobium miluonense TaxID=411945 RepID=A0A1C3WRN3_9HYPH|nr:barstar family protein [Rhizobium miluonense]SCB42722.1 Barstar, RNAse (barnase) inhibitor [Rhizobium miluonense]